MNRLAIILAATLVSLPHLQAADQTATVTNTPGLVAFWDFVKREPDGARRFTAHVPAGARTDYPLDAANYIKDYWGAGREATYADFPQLGRGPFGNAIRIVKETDSDFRPFLFVPREGRLLDTAKAFKGRWWVDGVEQRPEEFRYPVDGWHILAFNAGGYASGAQFGMAAAWDGRAQKGRVAFFDGDIAEVLVKINEELSNDGRRALEDYRAAKYGLNLAR